MSVGDLMHLHDEQGPDKSKSKKIGGKSRSAVSEVLATIGDERINR